MKNTMFPFIHNILHRRKVSTYPQAIFSFPNLDIENDFQKGLESNEYKKGLYKYMRVDGVLRFLDNAELLYSNPFLFNDPFDCMANVSTKNASLEEWQLFFEKKVSNRLLVEYCSKHALSNPDYAEKIVQTSIQKAKKTYGILCLTGKDDDILMWSHYADCHKGVCIKFDISCDIPSFYRPRHIEYSDIYPTFNYINDSRSLVMALYHKSRQWNYEDEYRVIKPNGFGLHAIKKECVKSIIFGCRTTKEDEDKIRLKVKERFFNVKFKRAVQNDDSYRLNIVDIE